MRIRTHYTQLSRGSIDPCHDLTILTKSKGGVPGRTGKTDKILRFCTSCCKLELNSRGVFLFQFAKRTTLKHGADAYIDQNTSDHLVAAAGNLDSATLNLLLDHRANINGPDKSRGYALHAACSARSRESSSFDKSTCRVVEELLGRGADPNLGSQHLEKGPATPLQLACHAGKLKTASLLLKTVQRSTRRPTSTVALLSRPLVAQTWTAVLTEIALL